MAFEYRPYVKIKTNVDINKLKYSLTILDVSSQKILNKSGFNIDYSKKYNFIKSGSNYRTDFLKLHYNMKVQPLETLRNLVIIFNLFRLDNKNKEHQVIKNYYVNNMVEDFEISIYQNIKLDIVSYLEKNDQTKVVSPKNIHTVELPITSKRIFICKEYPPNSKVDPLTDESKDPFTKESVEASLFNRLKEPFPDQKNTNLCGPAAFFYCVLTSNKNIYKKIVKSLWEKGEVTHGRLTIKPNKDGARFVSHYYDSKGVARITPVDWITMGSLRDTANSITDYNRASGNGLVTDFINGITAFTMPDELKNWFSQIGFSVPLYESFIRQKTPRSVDWLNVIKNLYKYPSKDYYYVILTIGAITLEGGDLPKIASFPSHYVVINSDIKTKTGIVNNSTNKDEYINASCFNWGKQDQLKNITLKTLSHFIWAIIVVKRDLT